jgi:predicted NodU family carbamoyl transferase
MNTSFNIAGDPLVETPYDAIQTLKKSKLEYIYFSDLNLLTYKKNEV